MSQERIDQAIRVICERLTHRKAVLFLGAGVNWGITNSEGTKFPLGQGLANLISKDLLKAPELEAPLDEAAEIARTKVGAEDLNNYIYKVFSTFNPSSVHTALVQLPWDVIYTTNYDLLVEEAARSSSIQAAGNICPIVSSKTDLETFTEQDILYYKLHGSIDAANTDEGRLILTKEDFRFYRDHRRRLFARLERDLGNKTFVFVGYSLVDSNLRELLEDCLGEIGISGLPESYSIRPGFQDIEEAFWKTKYNIQLIKSDGADFLARLKDSWISQKLAVIPFDERKEQHFVEAEGVTQFERVGDSFYRLDPTGCRGSSDPANFFRGSEPSWADIRDGLAPKRDMYWSVLDALLIELTSPSSLPATYLVTGAAGTGKTTLIRSLLFDLAIETKNPILVHIPGTPLDARTLTPLINKEDPKRLVVAIHHASEIQDLSTFIADVRSLRLPVTVLLEERENQWASATIGVQKKLTTAEFKLGSLSPMEIREILDALEKNDCLGKLTGMERHYQEEHFTALADRELLVALRELTTDGTFDQIIQDEFVKIPSEVAKNAYVYVAAFGQLDLPVRYVTLQHILGLSWAQLGQEVFTPTRGILITGEETGSSRHNADFRLRVRHPVIGSIIFDLAAPDDNSKFEVVNRLIEKLDPGHSEDRSLLYAIVKGKELIKTFSSKEFRRAVYDRLASVLPDDPFVLQHRSILERELDNSEACLKFAQRAVELEPFNPALKNTLGLAFEFAARKASRQDALKKRGWLSEATKIFQDGIKRYPSDPFNYVGEVLVMRQRIENEGDTEKRDLMKTQCLSLLEEAMESTNQSTIIASHLGKQWEQLGEPDEAIKILEKGLKKDPTNSRLRELMISLLTKNQRLEEAYKIALEGARIDPTYWRLQRHIARLAERQGESIEAVKGHYEAAIRHNKGDVRLHVELAAFLFMNGRRADATKVFKDAQDIESSGYEKTDLKVWWKDDRGKRKIFSGKVSRMSGATAQAISIPENIECFFWKTHAEGANLKVGDKITFSIGFNALGPVAKILLGRSEKISV